MPTGYTANIQSGEVTELSQFVLQCARAFGALIEMRDLPSDAPIPDVLPMSTYHADRIAVANATLARIKEMSAAELEQAAEDAYQKERTDFTERRTRSNTENKNYNDMLAKVRKWKPPTSGHYELKAFMIQQLTTSIEHDHVPKRYFVQPTRVDGMEWYEQQRKAAEESIYHHEQEVTKETGRNQERSAWIKSLKESLT